jgi:hypothetical protein
MSERTTTSEISDSEDEITEARISTRHPYDRDDESASSRTSSIMGRFNPPPPPQPVLHPRIPAPMQNQSPLRTATDNIKNGLKKAFEALNLVKSREDISTLDKASSSHGEIARAPKSTAAEKLLPRPKGKQGHDVRMQEVNSESEYETDETDETEDETEDEETETGSSVEDSDEEASSAVKSLTNNPKTQIISNNPNSTHQNNNNHNNNNNTTSNNLHRQLQSALMAVPHRSTSTIPEEAEDLSDVTSEKARPGPSTAYKPPSNVIVKPNTTYVASASQSSPIVVRSNVKSPVEESFDVSDLSELSEDRFTNTDQEESGKVVNFSKDFSATKAKQNSFFQSAGPAVAARNKSPV